MYVQVYTIYIRPLSVQAQYSRSCPIISSSCYNSSLVTWTVVWLTAAKFKLLIFSVSQSRSRSLLPATSRHAQSWLRAPLGPMAIYLFNVKTFVLFCFSFRWSSLLTKEGLVFYIYIMVFTYYTLLHLMLHSFFPPRDWVEYIYI
jgi:hypothetical protein